MALPNCDSRADDEPPSYTDRDADSILDSGPSRPWASQSTSQSSQGPPPYYQYRQNIMNPVTGRPWPNDASYPHTTRSSDASDSHTTQSSAASHPHTTLSYGTASLCTPARGHVVNPVTGHVSPADPNSASTSGQENIHEAWQGLVRQRQPLPQSTPQAVGYVVNPVTGRRYSVTGSPLHTSCEAADVMTFVWKMAFMQRSTLVVLDALSHHRRYFVDFHETHSDVIVHRGADVTGPSVGKIHSHAFNGDTVVKFKGAASGTSAVAREVNMEHYSVVLPACPAGARLVANKSDRLVRADQCMWKHSLWGESFSQEMKLVDGSETTTYAAFSSGGSDGKSRLSILLPGLQDEFVDQIVVSIIALMEKRKRQKGSTFRGTGAGTTAALLLGAGTSRRSGAANLGLFAGGASFAGGGGAGC